MIRRRSAGISIGWSTGTLATFAEQSLSAASMRCMKCMAVQWLWPPPLVRRSSESQSWLTGVVTTTSPE